MSVLEYRAEGMAMWDTWYLAHRGRAHLFHLQRPAPNSSRNPADADWLGHAVSDDLLHWVERPLALGPGEPGSLDEMQPWTGCVCEHAGRFYLFYTMRTRASSGFGQHIGVALSDDLDHWERFPGNPVISPDPRFYISHEQPLPRGVLDCRDLIVLPNPDEEGWLGWYAARVPAEEEAETAVIAAVRSPDLLTWEHLPPAFAPRKYACIEVPDVFALNGRWYLTCLTGNGYGNRGIFSDPHVIRGTIYAVADRPEGPYDELEDDNVLIGGDMTGGYSCRSLLFEGERYVFYTQPNSDGHATLSPPMRLIATPDGRLRAAYSPRTQAWRRQILLAMGETPPIAQLPYTQSVWPLPAGRWRVESGGYRGESRTGWQVADLGIGSAPMEIEAVVTLQEGVATGLVFRPDSALAWPGGDVVLALDAADPCAFAAQLPDLAQPRRRRLDIRHGQPYHLRVSVRPPRWELFVNDILILQFALALPAVPAPSLGLFIDRGRAEITGLAAYALGA